MANETSLGDSRSLGWDPEATRFSRSGGLPPALRAVNSMGSLLLPPAGRRPATTNGGLRGRAIGAAKTGTWLGRDGHVESNLSAHFRREDRLGGSSSSGALPRPQPEWNSNRPATGSRLPSRDEIFTHSGAVRPSSRAGQAAGRRRLLLGSDFDESRASSEALALYPPDASYAKPSSAGGRRRHRTTPEKPPVRRSGFDPRNAIQQIWSGRFAEIMRETELEAQKVVDLRTGLLAQIIDEEGFHLEKVQAAFDGTEEAAVDFLESAEDWLQRREDEVWTAAGIDPSQEVFERERQRVADAAKARREDVERRRDARGGGRDDEKLVVAAQARGRRTSMAASGAYAAKVRRGSVMPERPETPPESRDEARELPRSSSLIQDALERLAGAAQATSDGGQSQRRWAVQKEMEPDDRALALMRVAAAAATRRALEELEEAKEKRRAGQMVTVRVCVSCTTRDTHGERQCMQEEVAPELNAWGEQHGLRFEFIDAATQAAATRAARAPEVNAVYEALDRVDACRPFFVGIVTQRWGEVPSRYIDTGPSGGGHSRWLNLWKPGFSFTALELLYAGLHLGDAPASRQHAFVFVRHGGFLDGATRDQQDYFRDPAESRAIDELRLANLRDSIASNPGVECYGYSCVLDDLWDNLGRGGWRVTGLSALRESVVACIKRAAVAEFALQDLAKEHRAERDAQVSFMRERSAPFFGRADVLRTIAQFVHHWAHPHGPHQRPGDAALVLAGEAGIGKTATLARFLREVADARTAFPGVKVAYVFVGASVQSWYARDVLNWLCEEMEDKPRRVVETKLLTNRRAAGVPEAVLAANPEAVPPLQEVRRAQYEELATRFRELLWRYDQQKLLIVLDGANQMVFGQHDSPSAWIPQWSDVSGFVKLIVSSTDPAPYVGRLTDPSAASTEESNVVRLRPLPAAEGEALLRADDVVRGDKAAAAIAEGVAAKRDGGKPLYLRLVARELAATAAPGGSLAAAAAALPGTVSGLLDAILARLESVHRRDVVRGSLCLVACARHGVAVAELRELLANLCVAVPQEDLDVLLDPESPTGLASLLRRTHGSWEEGGDHLAFIHRDVKRAVRGRYLHACTAGGDAKARLKGAPGPGCSDYRSGDGDCGHLAPWGGGVVLGHWEDKEGRLHRAFARHYIAQAVSPARDRGWHTRRSAEWAELRRHLALGLSWDLVYRAENRVAIDKARMDPHEIWSIVVSLTRRAPALAGSPGYKHFPPGVPTPRETRLGPADAGPGPKIPSRLGAPTSSSALGGRRAAEARPPYAEEPGTLRFASLEYAWVMADARALAGALEADLPVATLDLSGNPTLAREHLREVFGALRENRVLRALRLAGTRPGDAAVLELASALAENSVLTELDLSDCALRADAAAALARPLESRYCGLRTLKLACCQIADDGCAALAAALPRAARLTALDLSANGITHRTAVALFKAVGENTTLKHLTVSANPIGDGPIAYLADSLRQNATLTGLVFGSNSANQPGIGCTSEGASAIAEALEQNRSLTSLDLDGNEVDDVGAQAFVRVLRWNRSIIHLDLTENRCGEDALAAVRDALRLNREYFWRRDAARTGGNVPRGPSMRNAPASMTQLSLGGS